PIRIMWDFITHLFARILTLAWFAGAILMILTIPACMYKIFSALWESDEEEDQAVYEKVRKV
ncbi:MAG TPA: hypothetical protein VG498_04405, partial [Terriglobales bacterium]|nr:hypothetical protein [Terriglobales bacterium]